MLMNITSKIYSTLGSNSSLVPLAIKDIANSAGITAGSYITGKKTESQDRFIDEFGTQAIWLCGIPFYKKLADLTLYKIAGIDPKFDARNINRINKLSKGTAAQKADAAEFAKILLENTPEHLKKSVQKALSQPKKVKYLSLIKFGISTALAIATYVGLTEYRQKFRLKQEMETLRAQKANPSAKTIAPAIPSVFKTVHKNGNLSFTGGLSDFMFNPVKNLMILDGAITTARLKKSESKQEFINYAIKETGTWTFMYFAGPIFKKYFENKVMQNPKKGFPINIDSRIIECKELKEALENGSMKQSLINFDKICQNASHNEVYKFIFKNGENDIIKMAKKSGIISTVKNSDVVDTRAFIDIESLKDLKNNLAKLTECFEKAVSKAKTSDEKAKASEIFLKKVKSAKRASILKNMSICIGALGIVVPLLMIASRYIIPNNKEYKVKEAAALKLAEEKNGTVI